MDVANVLEIQNVSQMIEQLDNDEKRLSGIFTNGGPQKLLTVTKKGLKRLLGKTRSHHAKELATRLGFHESIITTAEQDTLETIINAISGIISYKTQYSVEGYRVDLYLPEINMAIECDEHDHVNRDTKYERKREQEIIRSLGCGILRFNPYEPGFNIGNVISMILKSVCFQIKNYKTSFYSVTDDVSNQKQPKQKITSLSHGTETPKSYRGWTLNKRVKNKNGKTACRSGYAYADPIYVLRPYRIISRLRKIKIIYGNFYIISYF